MRSWKKNFENVHLCKEGNTAVVDEEVAKISEDEVRKPLKRMKSVQTGGPDRITVEVAVKFLFKLICLNRDLRESEDA